MILDKYIERSLEALPTIINCEACSKNISKFSQFCPSCGHPTERSLKFNSKSCKYLDLSKVSVGLFESIHEKNGRPQGKFPRMVYLVQSDLPPPIGFNFGDSFQNLLGLNLSFNENLDISSIKNLSQLEYLNLEGSFIQDLSPIKKLNSLRILILDGKPSYAIDWGSNFSFKNKFAEQNLDILFSLKNLEFVYCNSNLSNWKEIFNHCLPNCRVFDFNMKLEDVEKNYFLYDHEWFNFLNMIHGIDHYSKL